MAALHGFAGEQQSPLGQLQSHDGLPLRGSLGLSVPRNILRRSCAYLVLILFIEFVYVFVVSAGSMWRWPTYMNYYDLLAEGFRAGHLHLSVEPPQQLLAEKNPFDPAFARLWLGDASLHGGHYYIYWGPLPALLLAAAKALFRISRPVGDQTLVFVFFSLAATFTTLFLGEVRRRLFPRLPLVLFVLSVLGCTLGNPILCLLASGSVYQAAIAGGQAFLCAGLFFALLSIPHSESPGPHRWTLIAAGSAWACALACRISLAPAVAALVAVTLVFGDRAAPEGRARSLLVATLSLLIPVALVSSALLLYNRLRFDAWFEAGVGCQLTTWGFRFSPRYFVANLHEYLLRAPTFSCRFPFLGIPYRDVVSGTLPDWVPFQRGYIVSEPVAGIVWALPLVWTVPVALTAARRFFVGRRATGSEDDGQRLEAFPAGRLYTWCVFTLAVLGSVTLIGPLGLYTATMRYLGDVYFGLAMLGTLGVWSLYARAVGRLQQRAAATLGIILSIATITVSLLIGYHGYTGHFRRFNPDLATLIESTLKVCR